MSEKKSRQQKDCHPSQFYLIYRPDDRDAAISTDAPKSPTTFGATHANKIEWRLFLRYLTTPVFMSYKRAGGQITKDRERKRRMLGLVSWGILIIAGIVVLSMGALNDFDGTQVGLGGVMAVAGVIGLVLENRKRGKSDT